MGLFLQWGGGILLRTNVEYLNFHKWWRFSNHAPKVSWFFFTVVHAMSWYSERLPISQMYAVCWNPTNNESSAECEHQYEFKFQDFWGSDLGFFVMGFLVSVWPSEMEVQKRQLLPTRPEGLELGQTDCVKKYSIADISWFISPPHPEPLNYFR